MTSIRIKQGGQPIDSFFVVLTSAANITDPGWKIGHGDYFFVQPGKIRDEFQAHHACLAFPAGK
jgi:hypothetical protein